MPQQYRFVQPVISGSSIATVVNPNISTLPSSLAALEALYGCQWIWAY